MNAKVHVEREGLAQHLATAEEHLAEVLEFASGLREELSIDGTLGWLINDALAAWTTIREARRLLGVTSKENETASSESQAGE